MKRILSLAITLLLTAPALAQTAPELFIFKPGTPIRADEMNANFQLLKDHVTNALGLADLTGDDLEALAQLVTQIQALAESGELDGTSLEYAWDGTSLGIRHEGEEAFTYVDLRGATGPQGEPGPGLDFTWDGLRLGVRVTGDDDYTYQDLRGPTGATGATGPQGDPGEPGPAGRDGADGRNLVFEWNGTQLGVGYEGDALIYVDLQGAQGIQGIQGEQGPRGEQGEQGPQGERGEPGPQGPRGDIGPEGPAGPEGPQGPQGPEGPQGPQGFMGPPGTMGADGRGIEFHWDGTLLGVKYEGDTTYEYVDLQGMRGPGLQFHWDGTRLAVKGQDESEWSYADLKGDPGPQGPQGPQGDPGDLCTLGDVWLTAAIYRLPRGTAEANGALLSVHANPALYSLLGSAYGGDGTTTFALPNLSGAVPNPNMRYVICIQGIFPN